MSKVKLLRSLLFITLICLVGLLACSGEGDGSPATAEVTATMEPSPPAATEPPPDEPVQSDQPTPSPAATNSTPGGDVTYGEAQVESIEILLLESFPLQVNVIARGNLSDGCTTIAEIDQERIDDTFQVTITTQRPAEQLCTEALVPFEETISLDVAGLEAGSYTVRVNGVSETFEMPQDNVLPDEPEGTPEAVGLDVPAGCLPSDSDRVPYFNLDAGYCLQYPAGFEVGDVFPEPMTDEESIAAIYGPPLDESLEPLRAGLSITVESVSDGRSLAEVVDEVEQGYPDVPITRTETTLGGELAIVLDGVPGRTENRQLYTIHEDALYQLTLYPTDEQLTEVQADVTALWTAVTESFSFLPATFVETVSDCPAGDQERSPYLNVDHAYCLLYPTHFSLRQDFATNTVVLSSPRLDPLSPEPVQATLMIEVTALDGSQTVTDLVDEVAGEFPDISLTREETTLDGEPAEIIEGVPGRTESRQLYVIHNGRLYHLTVTPLDEAIPEAADDVAAVWESVVGSFTFINDGQTDDS